ncbi:hypothetical protein [Dyadobacter beijingensis]|uniref:hypothetical protein n=1 Tax=Dyadobacter beijingensis TaxID=365489 RepID=UPI001B7FE440|nr:hypothetical protein [Dyadobacter beijingensis]
MVGCTRAGVKRFVFTSTSNVYCSGYHRPAKEDEQVDINDPLAYSSSKVAARRPACRPFPGHSGYFQTSNENRLPAIGAELLRGPRP